MKRNLSVVIPNYNGSALLSKNLPPLLHQLEKGDEVIVVDDASTDNSIEVLKQSFPEVTVLRNYSNKRFQFSCNKGVQHAKSEFVLLLNSDVRPLKNCIKNLREYLASTDENFFSVGLAELDKKENRSGRAVGSFQKGLILHDRAQDQDKTTTLWTTGGSMAFRKSIWNILGGFDVLFSPAYEEDRDISYRALKRGYQIAFLPTAEVFHDHKTTNITALGKHRIEVASMKNAFLLNWKNLTDSRYLVLHVLWLPYHLAVGSFRSKGVILQGFIEAMYHLPSCLRFRRSERAFIQKSDHEVLKEYGAE